MSFIRPEVTAGIRRWREVIFGGVLAVVGLWLLADGIGARFWAGCLITALGVALMAAGIPRARTRVGGGGAGVVDIDEQRITYFGPVSGGAMAVDDIQRIAADPERRWVLTSVSGEFMTIPMDAEGADQLFDAFSALPGVSQTRLVHALTRDVERRRVVWERPQLRLG